MKNFNKAKDVVLEFHTPPKKTIKFKVGFPSITGTFKVVIDGFVDTVSKSNSFEEFHGTGKTELDIWNACNNYQNSIS